MPSRSRLGSLRRENQAPTAPFDRTGYWEGFPGPEWGRIIRNSKKLGLRTLNGGSDHQESLAKLKNVYWQMAHSTNIVAALLASVDVSALAIPGIETSHWLSRSFLISSALFAIGTICINGLKEGTFSQFFAEDMEVSSATSIENQRSFLNWETDHLLLTRIDNLLRLPSMVIVVAVYFFIAGMITFVTTASFGEPSPPPSRAAFAGVSLGPLVAYMCWFWWVWVALSYQHRRTRMKKKAVRVDIENVAHPFKSTSRLKRKVTVSEEESG